jgi:hypothetical protein
VPVTYAERRNEEVYVYVRGRLVMKVWLLEDANRVAVFHVAPNGARYCVDPNYTSDTAW